MTSLTDPSRWLDEDKPVAFPLTCAEVREAFGLEGYCCCSCHDDWDEGYESPIEMYDWYSPEIAAPIWAVICCATHAKLGEVGIE